MPQSDITPFLFKQTFEDKKSFLLNSLLSKNKRYKYKKPNV